MRTVVRRLDRRDVQPAVSLRKIACQRSPHDRHIYIALGDGIDDRGGRVGGRGSRRRSVAAHVVDDATPRQRMRGRGVLRVVANHLHTDPKLPQPWVIERGNIQMPVVARDEHVSRAVVRPRRRQRLDTARDAQPKVAEIAL